MGTRARQGPGCRPDAEHYGPSCSVVHSWTKSRDSVPGAARGVTQREPSLGLRGGPVPLGALAGAEGDARRVSRPRPTTREVVTETGARVGGSSVAMTGRRGLLGIPIVTAATRLDFLSRRDSAAAVQRPAVRTSHSWTDHLRGRVEPLDLEESLELLDLGVVVARQAYDAQHRGIRAALRAGASWEQIGAALGTMPLTAWNDHQRWIEEQVELFELTGRDGLDDVGAVEALELAGERPVGLGHTARLAVADRTPGPG